MCVYTSGRVCHEPLLGSGDWFTAVLVAVELRGGEVGNEEEEVKV